MLCGVVFVEGRIWMGWALAGLYLAFLLTEFPVVGR